MRPIIRSNKRRTYLTITDPETRKSKSLTISGATRDEVVKHLRKVFSPSRQTADAGSLSQHPT